MVWSNVDVSVFAPPPLLVCRVDVPVNSDSLAGVRLGPSIAFPGTIGVLGVDAKDDAVKKVGEWKDPSSSQLSQ